MAILVSGSLAFDTITNFPGRFADQILPDQVHILNVSFLVPTLRRELGGCAGNIAYTLRALGSTPVVLAALGNDGGDYLARMQAQGMDTRQVLTVADTYTAQAIIITDADNNQITAFHPGAMMRAHEIGLPEERSQIRLALIGPDGREAMLRRAQDLADAGIPFVFDPGQGLPMFNGEELAAFVAKARWVALNDYEARMLTDRMGTDLATLSRSHLAGVIVTLGADGCEVWIQGECHRVAGVQADAVLDPTGCGDAFRGGLLHGLEQGWDLLRCVRLGNRLGALKIACRGGQNHVVSPELLAQA
ncbi:carbohydrate kinase family protein [Ideonella livida]|uniref:Carbohydrate kinase family protein n=1 Tax=Ideonella livida TaxID=2707176 RepID=A0A7C9PK84_9BURK|nr:carbohydrate kinase family protein [Ideonella livida]NDY93054.1 carbohydrate kinase family protein [Ideonella livida]